jgi:hypothetical protein
MPTTTVYFEDPGIDHLLAAAEPVTGYLVPAVSCPRA